MDERLDKIGSFDII